MPLFKCSCGLIENTALTPESWGNIASGKPPRCSECSMGKWHEIFPKMTEFSEGEEDVFSKDK